MDLAADLNAETFQLRRVVSVFVGLYCTVGGPNASYGTLHILVLT